MSMCAQTSSAHAAQKRRRGLRGPESRRVDRESPAAELDFATDPAAPNAVYYNRLIQEEEHARQH